MGPADAFLRAVRERSAALVMGVVNVTPDSFSDGGRNLDPETAAKAGRAMIAEGAALLDVGGESTRPGAEPVPASAEAARVLPVLSRLAGLPASVDTRKAEVARLALGAGACAINDVSAGADPGMLPLAAGSGCALILMHMRGDPATMQEDPRYTDVVAEVEEFLLERARAAEAAGVGRERILLDPGIGFGKRAEHNWAILAALPRLSSHGYPVVVGVSRKRLLGEATGRALADRRDATTAAVALAAFSGAAVVRVHEVAPAVDACRVAAAWRSGIE